MSEPKNMTEWLESELDKKIATLPTDREKYRHLILLGNVWRQKYRTWVDLGDQPFNEPHPVWGDMTAWDFSLLLTMIDQRKSKLEHQLAH